MAVRDLVGILEAAYRVDLDEATWLRGIIEAAEPLMDRGFGISGYVYDSRAGAMPVIGTMHFSTKFDPAWLQSFRVEVPQELTEEKEHTPLGWRDWMHLPCNTASSVPQLAPWCDAMVHFGGARDIFTVNGTDPTRFGVWIGAPLPHRTAVTSTSKKLYTRVATHLAAAYRVRRRLAPGARPTAEAVLRPDGRVDHAEGSARSADAREALRQAALRIERSRTRIGRIDPDAATEAWHGLVRSRWSLVETDAPGEPRRLVATRNESAPVSPDVLGGLSRRELQVIGFAALGRADRDIAYDLGLTPATVRVVLHRAGKKLGCTNRRALLERYAALRRGG